MTPRIAIIGGGYAGIGAAVTLAEAGLSSHLFESNTTLGGRARRVSLMGKNLDNGQHLLLGAYQETLRLIKLVNSTENANTSRRYDTTLLSLPITIATPNSVFWQLPTSSRYQSWFKFWSLYQAPGLSWQEKLAVLRLLSSLYLRHFNVEPDLTVASLLQRHRQTSKIIQFIWEPLCLGALNTPMHLASAQVYARVLQDSFFSNAENSKFLLPQVDLSTLLPEPAQQWLIQKGSTVETGARIKRIRRTTSSCPEWILETQHASHSFTDLILATAPWQSASLLAEIPTTQHLTKVLNTITYQAILTYYRTSKKPLIKSTHFPILQLTDGPGQWLIDRSSITTEPIEQNYLYAIVISAPNRETLSSKNRSDWTSAIENQLQNLFPDTWTGPTTQHLIIEKRATHTCSPIQQPDIATLHATAFPNLYLAGDYTYTEYPATLESAVRSGIRAGNNLLKTLLAAK